MTVALSSAFIDYVWWCTDPGNDGKAPPILGWNTGNPTAKPNENSELQREVLRVTRSQSQTGGERRDTVVDCYTPKDMAEEWNVIKIKNVMIWNSCPNYHRTQKFRSDVTVYPLNIELLSVDRLCYNVNDKFDSKSNKLLNAADLLRLIRVNDTNITEVTVFAIPSLVEPHCILEMQVKWAV